jgi:hypothetical protein
MTGKFFSPLASAIAKAPLLDVKGTYPKFVVELSFSVIQDGGATVTFPPDSIVARVDVIHTAGLEGEYEWIKLLGKDIKPATGKKRNAHIRETLPDTLRLPGYYKLRVRSQSLYLRLEGLAQCSASVKMSLIDTKGKANVIYDENYSAPRGGVRTIDDVVMPELPPFGP